MYAHIHSTYITYIHVHACIHAYLYTYIHTYMHTLHLAYTYVHTYIHAYIHSYKHTFILLLLLLLFLLLLLLLLLLFVIVFLEIARFDALEKNLKSKLANKNELNSMWKLLDFNGNNMCSLAEIDKWVSILSFSSM
jgi:hypothetical protein